MTYRASQKAVFAHFTSKQMLSAYFASCSAIMRQQHSAPEERRRWKRNVEIRKNFVIGSLHAMYLTGRFMLFTSSNKNGFIAQYIYVCIFNDCVHSPIQPAVVTCCHHTTFVSNMCFYCVCEHIFFHFPCVVFARASIVLRFCFVRMPLHRFLLLVVGLSFCCKCIYLFVCFVRYNFQFWSLSYYHN